VGAMRCHAAGVCSFSFSPSKPPPTRQPATTRHLPPLLRISSPTVLHLPRFNPLASIHERKLLAKPSAKSHLTPRAPPPVPSKPDRPTLIDLLISTIVLYLPARTSFLPSSLNENAILGVTSDFCVFLLYFQDFSPVVANYRRKLNFRKFSCLHI